MVLFSRLYTTQVWHGEKHGLITVNPSLCKVGVRVYTDTQHMTKHGNTVGSLTTDQLSIVIGSLLGDGYMSCKTHAYLKIGHSFKQKDYVDWKYSFLSSLVLTKPKAYRGNNNRIGYRFTTRSLPILTPLYQSFYGNNQRKTIPDSLFLSPLALAVWYMDDGAKNRKGAYLNTQQFSYGEQVRLLAMLKQEFGLEGNLNIDKKYFRIRLFQASAQELKRIIIRYVPDCMKYKLPL